jgi:2-succinyl-6-hydroxy-2,4-cyclohexadiene-1-carboxylate synthase
MEWVRGWLWAQGKNRELVLCGYTLGAAIAIEYGLTYPNEVSGLVLSSTSLAAGEQDPSVLELRLKAAEDPAVYEQWFARQRHAMKWVEPELADLLMERHRQVGPMSQYRDLAMLRSRDVRDRIDSLKPQVLLVHGEDDPISARSGEPEMHQAIAGSVYEVLPRSGHFPGVENPHGFKELLDSFLGAIAARP